MSGDVVLPPLKLSRRAFGLFLASLAAGCAPFPTAPTLALPETTVVVPATRISPPPPESPTTIPGRPEEVWLGFVDFWARGNYQAMYGLLTDEAQRRTGADEFARYYQQLQERVTLRRLSVEITSSLVMGNTAQVGFDKLLVTDKFGTIEERQSVNLILVSGQWYIAWHPSMVLAALDYGSSLAVDEMNNTRGVIYDRTGKPLASLGTRVVVGVVPGEIEDEAVLLQTLADVLHEDQEKIRSRYINALRADWFMPVGELSAKQAQDQYTRLSSLPGVLLRERPVRFYPEGAVTAHLTGYVGVITPEQLAELRASGYHEDDVVGQTGLEQYFEGQLAGKRGARLIVLGANGETRSVAAERPAQPSQSLYTTIDLGLQRQAMALLEGKRGAIIALDPNTGQVLTLASSPSFDPNAILAGMPAKDWNKLLEDEGRPLVNRATQSELPLGSVFKIVTESAVLGTGLFKPDSPFYCSGTWDGLGPGWVKHCWLRSGHGSLTLEQGLTASCDVVFYELGKALHEAGRDILPYYAELFRFGARTEIAGVAESSGLVPNPIWKENAVGESWFPGDSVNLAIGQGHLLVTPLQVVDMIAALANGGTIYKPQLLLSLGQPPSLDSRTVEPEALASLPLSSEHLKSIQTSLLNGCMSPAGTAYYALGDMTIPVAGKTGTAENPGGEPHAWFAGYAPATNPQLAVVVMIENGGEGSKVAAPIFRQIVEFYLQSAPDQ